MANIPDSAPVAEGGTGNRLSRRRQLWLVSACVAVLGLGACANANSQEPDDDPAKQSTEALDPARAAADPTPTTEPTDAGIMLLFVTDQKDGDSWVASDGKEYRLGLINTPESNEPCGPEARAFTRAFLGAGFTANAYTTDTYGRSVAEVFDDAGESLNVALAHSGLGDDRYLEEFRQENPELARRLDSALAAAATPECRKAVAPVPLLSQPSKAPKPAKKAVKKPAGNCMTGYKPCLPVLADLDCGEIGHPVTVTGSDPYRLDRDRDGTGCD